MASQIITRERARGALRRRRAWSIVAAAAFAAAAPPPAGALAEGNSGCAGAVVPCSTAYGAPCDCYPCDPHAPHVVSPAPPGMGVPGVEDGSRLYEPPTGQIEGLEDIEGMDGAPTPEAGLPGGLGAVAAAEAPSMHMIGDFFASGYFLGSGAGFASLPAAGADRRFKATDNLSLLPQNRVFFNYHHFHHAVVDVDARNQSVDRYTFGLERAFFDEMVSFEVRLPFTTGLDSAQIAGSQATTSSEFGNIALTVKARLCECGAMTVSSGLATILPTASDASVLNDSGLSVVETKAVHLQPYLGVSLADSCSRWFSTGYVAVDVDLNGNPVLTGTPGGDGVPPSLEFLGDARDQTLLFVDWQLGYWCYQDYGHVGYLNAVAPVIELHYSRALDDPDQFSVLQNPFGTADLLNLTAGLMFDFRRTATLSVYGAAPLKKEDAVLFGTPVSTTFQSEFGAQFIYRY